MGLIDVNPAGIPPELAGYAQWVCWRIERRGGKPTKVPVAIGGGLARVDNPATWSTLQDVLDAWAGNPGDYDGIGFVLTPQDPFCGVDLDHCRDAETGIVEPWAQAIVTALASYTEVTPSGTGLRVWTRATLPAGSRRRGNVEMYDQARYFTVTGKRVMGTPVAIAERQAEIIALHRQTFAPAIAPSAPAITPSAPAIVPSDRDTLAPEQAQPGFADAELIERACTARNGTAFTRLWAGDVSGQQSPSEADLALCCDLAFWTGRDAGRIDRLFRRSGLMRPKWDELRGDQTYGARTIAEACRRTSETYAGTYSVAAAAAATVPAAAAATATASVNGSDSRPWPDPPAPEAYYGIAGEIVRAIEPHTEAAPVAILTTLLVVAGNMIGRGTYAIAESDQHACNLFACLVGPTAKARKGASWGRVRDIARRVDPAWLHEHVVNGLSSGEGLIHAVRDEVKRAGIVIEEGVQDKRLLAQEAEFSSLLKRAGREGNTLSDVLRVAWDGGVLRTLTKSSPAKASETHISILAHVTRDDLLRHMADTEAFNGFGNRFLWIAVRRSKELPDGGGAPEWGTLIERLRDRLAQGTTLGVIERDDAARQLWAGTYHELSEGRPGLLGAVTARAEAQVLRLSVLYAALDGSLTIGNDHLTAALALWDYAQRSAYWIFGDATGDPLADRLLDALRNAQDGLSRTAIHALLGRNQPAARIDSALGTLLRYGRVRREIRSDGRGRPEEVWSAIT